MTSLNPYESGQEEIIPLAAPRAGSGLARWTEGSVLEPVEIFQDAGYAI